MINLKWLISEQRQYIDSDPLAYENISVPFAIILGDPHTTERSREARRLEHNVIAQFLPEYILAEPGIGAWIFDPNNNEVRLREDEPPDCHEDYESMQLFLKMDINENYNEPQEAFQSFQDYNNKTDIFLDWTDFKLWSINHKIPLIGCDLCKNEQNRLERLYDHLGQEAFEIYNGQREEKMGEIIKTYANKSLKPIIAIIGRNHTESTSRIHSILRKENVGYLILRY